MLSIFTFYGGFGLFVLRLAVAAVLLVHGRMKIKDMKGTAAWMQSVGFAPGTLFAAIAVAVECLGGLGLLAGFGVQYVAFVAAGQFAVIILWKLKGKMPFAGGWELDLVILAALVALFFLGGGSYSLDRMLHMGV